MNPKRLLFAHNASYRLFVISIVLGCVMMIATFVFVDPALRPTVFIGVFLSLVAAMVSAIAIHGCIEKGALLVNSWSKIIGNADLFPQNRIECGGLRAALARDYLQYYGDLANSRFGWRDDAKAQLERHKKNPPPEAAEEFRSITDLHGFRTRKSDVLAQYNSYLKKLDREYRCGERIAQEEHRTFLGCWDLVKQLGERYEVDMLPADPSTGKPFDDPKKYLESLHRQDAPATDAPAGEAPVNSTI